MSNQSKDVLYTHNEKENHLPIPSHAINLIMSTEKSGLLLGLYVFLFSVAREQNTKKIHTKTEYIRDVTGIGIKTTRKLIKELIQLGLVEEERKIVSGKTCSVFIKLLFKWDKPLSYSPPNPIKQQTQKNTQKKLKIANELKRRYFPLAEKLASIVMENKNVTITPASKEAWTKQIKLLCITSKIAPLRIQKALEWYKNNITDQYTPVIHSGKSLREKFMQLENAMGRQNLTQKKRKNTQSQYETNMTQEELNKCEHKMETAIL